MPELDRYIPGVPCWIDTSQPDPEAAVAFYRDLFGWDVESVMPPEAPGEYFMARIRGGDVAGIGSIPEGSPPIATWNTYIWVDSADETAAKVKDAGGNVLMEPFVVMTSGRLAAFSDPEGAVFCVWEPNQHRGAQSQRGRFGELQQPQHARRRGRQIVLRSGVRMGDDADGRRRRRVDAARIRRSS